MCSFGQNPSSFTATGAARIRAGKKPIGIISDGSAGVNIRPFGLCSSMANPQVAAATTAAMGVLTPQPCIPQTKSWIPMQGKVIVGGKPCLTPDCKCMCAYGGVITVQSPGQMKVVLE